MFVDFNILNQLGSPAINSNTFANRPAAGQTGRLFVSTDTFEIYRDNGTTWDLIGGPGSSTITGTGTATQVAYFTSSQAIGSSSNLYWDNTNTRLGIGTSTPGVRLDIHGTGNMLHLNATGATANTTMSFQRLGSNVWRLGEQYSGGSNYFELHNAVLNNNAAEYQSATNKATYGALETYSSGGATGSLFSYTITIPNGTNFTGPNAIGSVNSYLTLNLGGNTTVPTSTRQGLEGNSRINFTGPGTLTITQGSTVRAFSALSSVYSFAGSSAGTITHLAGLRVCFPDNIGLGAINVTNNYGILINDQTTGTGTLTYTNRWGVYQEGASDLNYFNGNLLIKSTTNSGEALQVNGSAKATNVVISEQAAPATPASGTGIIYAKTDNNLYYKNDVGIEFNLTDQNIATNLAFTALGSAIIGYNPMNLSNIVINSKSLFDGTIYFIGYYLPVGATLTGVKWYQGTQGNYTADNYNGIGLFSYSGGTITLVASTTNDGNIWKATANSWQSKAFSSTYVAAAGMYFIGIICNFSAKTTDPSIGHGTTITASSYDFTNSARIICEVTGQTGFSASYAMSSLNASTFTYALFLY
jgi:hypothetical protein